MTLTSSASPIAAQFNLSYPVNRALGVFRAVEALEVHPPQSFDRFLLDFLALATTRIAPPENQFLQRPQRNRKPSTYKLSFFDRKFAGCTATKWREAGSAGLLLACTCAASSSTGFRRTVVPLTTAPVSVEIHVVRFPSGTTTKS